MKKTEIEFRGAKFDVNLGALSSVKVQKALALARDDQAKAYWAFDAICCGSMDEYLDRIPEEDGEVSELGASDEAFAAFMEAVAEAAPKN